MEWNWPAIIGFSAFVAMYIMAVVDSARERDYSAFLLRRIVELEDDTAKLLDDNCQLISLVNYHKGREAKIRQMIKNGDAWKLR